MKFVKLVLGGPEDKRTEYIKGRGCADGRPQRKMMAKSEALLQNPSTKAVIITCIRDVKEGRCVRVIDVPGAFL